MGGRSRFISIRVGRLSLGSLALAGGLWAAAALAEPLPTLSLVRDFSPGEEAVGPSSFPLVRAGEALYAVASDALHGNELWRYSLDGTGGERVADLCPGACSSSPRNLIALGDRLLFFATEPEIGTELWVTDGTSAGTHLVRDLCPGPCDSVGIVEGDVLLDPRTVAAAGKIVFAAYDGTSARFWASDGSAEGTRWIGLPFDSFSLSMVAFGGRAYLQSRASSFHGPEIWVSDGTPEGTRRFDELCAGGCPGTLVGASADWLLVETDPCAAGSNLRAFDRAGHRHDLPVCLPELANAAFSGNRAFVAAPSSHGLWSVDLAQGVVVEVGHDRLTATPVGKTAGGRFFFAGQDAAAGAEPWVSDGTPAGTRRLADLTPGPAGSFPRFEAALGDRALFSAASPAAGREPWVSDGTTAGTRLLGDLWPGPFVADPEGGTGASAPRDFTPVDATTALFLARTAAGPTLWRTDGTPQGTGRVRDLFATQPKSSVPLRMTPWGNRAFWSFLRTTEPYGEEIWVTDGTAAGTRRVTAASEAAQWDLPAVPLAGRLYFAAVTGAYSWTLRSGDGIAPETSPVPGDYASPSLLTATVTHLFFVAPDTTCPAGPCPGLYAYEPGGPAAVRVASGTAQTVIHDLTPVGNRLFFVQSDSTRGQELWQSTGSDASLVASLCSGSCPLAPHALAAFGDRLLFVVGTTLWLFDPAAGAASALHTFPVVGLFPSPASPREATSLGGLAFLLASTPDGNELWRTDGTPEGTVRVAELGGAPGTTRQLTAAGARLFFTVRSPETGTELWVSDGTAAGTRRVADLRPGAPGSAPQGLTAVGDRVLFAADDGVAGLELWSSDGTAAGTFRVVDLVPGPGPSSPSGITVTGDRIVFFAHDGVHGNELFALARAAALSNTCQPSATTLCLGGGRFAVTARWQAPNVFPGQGQAQTVPGLTTAQTGGFWFFDPANAELLVKILDGGPVNDHFWVFYGALSDVAYQIEVRDLATGLTRTYSNPAGTLCGRADVAAFPIAGAAGAAARADLGAKASEASRAAATATLPVSCNLPEAPGLCLGGRFFVQVEFRPPGAPAPQLAFPFAGTDDTGFFWFFDPANLELAVKVLDGTAVNGHFWVFSGALSDVEYTVRVLDTRNGGWKTYANRQGQLCGQADTAAF